MSKKIFPGLIASIIEGVPALIGIVKPLLKKKSISDAELSVKSKEELFNIVKEHQSVDEEPTWYMWLLKRAVTLATVYFVVWASKKLGVTGQDIITLFGILK